MIIIMGCCWSKRRNGEREREIGPPTGGTNQELTGSQPLGWKFNQCSSSGLSPAEYYRVVIATSLSLMYADGSMHHHLKKQLTFYVGRKASRE
jgi:hypothetical protein